MTICIQEASVNTVKQKPINKGDRYTLVVIDPSVDNWDVLVTGVNSGSKIILLDRGQDSIQQIDRLIKKYKNVANLHLVSHGTPGGLKLGSGNLDIETLNQDREIFESWSSYLSNASIYIYGCQVAKGIQGEDFLQTLHELVGTKIAASTEVVGNCELGNNWQFDYCIGQVEQQLAFTSETITAYQGTFEPVVSFSASPDTLIETEGTLLTLNFELNEPPPAGGVVVTVDGDIPESLNQLDLFALDVQGGDNLEGDLDFSGFSINITEQNATLSAPIFPDDDSGDAIVNDDNPLTPDDFEVTYSLQPGNGYEIDPEQNSGTVSFVDTPEDVTTEPEPEPESEDITVSISADNTTLIESEGSETTITISLDSPPPADGLVVDIGSGEAFSLGEFDGLPPDPQPVYTGGTLVQAFEDLSGVSFRVEEQTATITLPILDDADRSADDPEATRNDDIGVETYTYSLLESDDYNINSDASTINFTLADEPSQLESAAEDGEVTVFRFFDPNVGSHLYTSSEAESNSIQENLSNYSFEGPSYKALDPLTGEESDNISNVYRFFNPSTGAHLYTASEVERDNIIETLDNFNFEGEQFAVYNTDLGEETIPIHRFYNPTLGVHFYTPNEAERENVEANLPNYNYEGIAYYAIDLVA